MSSPPRLRSLPPDLQSRLVAASEIELRRFAADCAALGLDAAALDDAAVRAAATLSLDWSRGCPPASLLLTGTKEALAGTVARLDEVGFDLYDAADSAGELKSDSFQRAYRVAFNRARAANAVLAALQADPLAAAAEAAYELIAGMEIENARVIALLAPPVIKDE